jgi:hypothetical protein
MSGYCEIHALIDPDQFEEYPNGIRVQEIDLTITEDPGVPAWRAAPAAVCRIDARRAREFAFELLTLAEAAERHEESPR